MRFFPRYLISFSKLKADKQIGNSTKGFHTKA